MRPGGLRSAGGALHPHANTREHVVDGQSGLGNLLSERFSEPAILPVGVVAGDVVGTGRKGDIGFLAGIEWDGQAGLQRVRVGGWIAAAGVDDDNRRLRSGSLQVVKDHRQRERPELGFDDGSARCEIDGEEEVLILDLHGVSGEEEQRRVARADRLQKLGGRLFEGNLICILTENDAEARSRERLLHGARVVDGILQLASRVGVVAYDKRNSLAFLGGRDRTGRRAEYPQQCERDGLEAFRVHMAPPTCLAPPRRAQMRRPSTGCRRFRPCHIRPTRVRRPSSCT